MDINTALNSSSSTTETIVASNDGTNCDVITDSMMEYIGKISKQKMKHGDLILNGVCSKCAHCGLALTDSVSIERGLGPICHGKGYQEDEHEKADVMQAIICLAEFPEVLEFLVENYKPQGVRGLCNGLVRLASLNRKHDKLHADIANAIENLGYVKLANLLRESLCVLTIKDSTKHKGCLEVWVKRSFWKYAWSQDIRQIPGQFLDRAISRTIIPISDDIGQKYTVFNGQRMTNKEVLWELMIKHFDGMCGKKIGGSGFRITRKLEKK